MSILQARTPERVHGIKVSVTIIRATEPAPFVTADRTRHVIAA